MQQAAGLHERPRGVLVEVGDSNASGKYRQLRMLLGHVLVTHLPNLLVVGEEDDLLALEGEELVRLLIGYIRQIRYNFHIAPPEGDVIVVNVFEDLERASVLSACEPKYKVHEHAVWHDVAVWSTPAPGGWRACR